MARHYIKIRRFDSEAVHSGLLLQYIAALRTAYDLGRRVKGIMDNNQDGSAWQDLEGLFGIPGNSGQVVYDLVNGSVGSMEGQFMVADVKTLTERVG